nr:unnamed protein product [Callosobruchus analis]
MCTEVEVFSVDDLMKAVPKMKVGKAPGPDGIPTEVVKLFAERFLDACLHMMNRLFLQDTFPKIWKTAKLVLIDKEKKSGQIKADQRPLCLVGAMGKLFGHLLVIRLKEGVDAKGELSENQYGFVEGRSTVDALLRVKNITDANDAKPHRNREFCSLVALAFNSAS